MYEPFLCTVRSIIKMPHSIFESFFCCSFGSQMFAVYDFCNANTIVSDVCMLAALRAIMIENLNGMRGAQALSLFHFFPSISLSSRKLSLPNAPFSDTFEWFFLFCCSLVLNWKTFEHCFGYRFQWSEKCSLIHSHFAISTHFSVSIAKLWGKQCDFSIEKAIWMPNRTTRSHCEWDFCWKFRLDS